MKRLVRVSVLALFATSLAAQSSPPAWLVTYRPIATKLITQSRSTDFAWQRLAELTDTFGHRLSGSENLEKAIDWAVATMTKDGLENVHKEPVMVPKWVRGRETLELVQPVRQPLVVLGLGNSVATPAGGVESDVIVVKNFDDLEKHAAEVKGHIVAYNVPFTTYRETVAYRRNGPSRAAKLGAVAVLLRSVGPTGMRTPHTGGTVYEANTPQIPAAAISAGGGGTDIEPAGLAGNIPMLGHNEVDGSTYAEYFLIHHTEADTMARIKPRQVSDNAAAIAVMAYVLADLPKRLAWE